MTSGMDGPWRNRPVKSQASSGAPEEPREEEGETDVWAKPDRRPVMKAGF
jgi:hypothetical protein